MLAGELITQNFNIYIKYCFRELYIMEKNEFILELLTELSYRSDEGYPILSKQSHIYLLSEILDEWGFGEIKTELIQNLTEAGGEKKYSSPALNKVVKYKDRDGNDKEGLVGSLLRLAKDQPGREAAERALPAEGTPERDKINNELGGEGQPNRNIEKEKEDKADVEAGGEQQPAEEPQPGVFAGKGGDEYRANLPKNDSAYVTPDDKSEKDKTTKKIVSGEPNQKNKSLNKDTNTSTSEVYTSPTTGINDDDYKNQKEVELINPNVDYTNDINNIIEGSGIPLKYGKVLARLLNTKNRNQISILNVMSGVGAGQIASQAGEIVTMMAIGLDDDKSNQLFGKLNEIINSQNKSDYPIITKEWVESAQLVKQTTKKRYDNEFGAGKWSIENVAWDVKGEFEALGNPDYQANKGFSSDMYVKVNVNGTPVLDEISLKKDSQAMLFNGSVTDIKKWFGGDVPPAADFEIYKKGELDRPVDYAKNVSEDEYNSTFSKSDEDIIESMINSTGDIRKSLVNTGILAVNKKTNKMEVTPIGKDYIKDFRSLTIPPPIDRERYKEKFGTGAVDRFKKGMIVHASILANDGNKNAYNFLDKHLGYTKGVDGRYPEGSIKRYQNDTIRALVESDKAKNALLEALQEKLPMKALIEGEEKMAIGGLSVDSNTLKNLMNIESFEDFKGGLEMEEDDEGNNYLVYKSLGPPAKEVKISEVKVRQKGQGYASSVGLEFVIAPDFAKQLYESNVDIYGSVEISKKEKSRLKV